MRLFGLLLGLLACSAQADSFSGKVVAVLDGDTVLVLRNSKPVKVRLLEIDAPEKAQPYGMQSRQSLQDMVGKKVVLVETRAVDQYGRLLGQLSLNGMDINREQVRRGMAWEYSNHHSDRAYVALQHEAQQAKRGLWAQAAPQAPWQWRKAHPLPGGTAQHKPLAAPRGTPVMLYDLQCGKKRRCSEMNSCDEAHFYLTRCGVASLDGDHDGEPCKALCSGKK